MLSKFGIPVIVIALIIIFSVLYFGFNKIDELATDNARLNSQLNEVTQVNQSLSRDLGRFREEVEANANELRRVNNEVERIDTDRRIQETELRAAIGRQDTVFERPSLVERMVQRNWKQFTDGISCDTGARERCND